jgi:hypothetical protein
MTKAEVEAAVGKLPAKNFAIAGVKSKYSFNPVTLNFRAGKLDSLFFAFDAKSFPDVLEAVKEEYPALSCAESTVSHPMGTSFKQVGCTLKDKTGTLRLMRVDNDVNTSALTLQSNRGVKEPDNKQKDKKKGS